MNKAKYSYRIREDIMIDNVSFFYPEIKDLNDRYSVVMDYSEMLLPNKKPYRCSSYEEALDVIEDHKKNIPIETIIHSISNNNITDNILTDVILTDMKKENISIKNTKNILELIEYYDNNNFSILYGSIIVGNDSEDNFDVSLKNASHIIYNVRLNHDNFVVGDIKFLNIDNGKYAFDLISGDKANFKLRYNNSGVFTWDIKIK